MSPPLKLVHFGFGYLTHLPIRMNDIFKVAVALVEHHLLPDLRLTGDLLSCKRTSEVNSVDIVMVRVGRLPVVEVLVFNPSVREGRPLGHVDPVVELLAGLHRFEEHLLILSRHFRPVPQRIESLAWMRVQPVEFR